MQDVRKLRILAAVLIHIRNMTPFTNSLDALTKLRSKYLGNIPNFNESDTRLKVIDEILFDVLAWSKYDVDTERYHSDDYTDYELKIPRPKAILEAKKIGNTFELPYGSKSGIQPIKQIIKVNKNMAPVFEQVVRYCNTRGVEIGIISNGFQFIGFLATRTDSIPPMEGNCMVFTSLQDAEDMFGEFWNSFSKDGLVDSYLTKRLQSATEPILPKKPSAKIYRYPGTQTRNPIQHELNILSEVLIEDAISNEELRFRFLEDCYCSSGALSEYSQLSKKLLESRYDKTFSTGDNVNFSSVTSKKGINTQLTDSTTLLTTKRPILLIGDVGCGKSLFIDRLINVDAVEFFVKSLYLKIDLGHQAITGISISDSIINIIIRSLKVKNDIDIYDNSFVRECYKKELIDVRNRYDVKPYLESHPEKLIEKEIERLTIYVENVSEHLKRSIQHLHKNRNKQVVIFIDNCDQRSNEDQQSAFLVAQEISSEWEALVFLSLRPETYHDSKREHGALSGYSTTAFTIKPPRIDEVITKRLLFAKMVATGEIPSSKIKAQLRLDKIVTMIDTLLKSLERHTELYECLQNISNGNVRLSIEIVRDILGSGHIDSKKIVNEVQTTGKYTIPVHEFLRSVILENSNYFNPLSSRVYNMFDISYLGPINHFLIPILLTLLSSKKSNANFGYCNTNDVYNELIANSFKYPAIDKAIHNCIKYGLIERSERGKSFSSPSEVEEIRITEKGDYHINYLIFKFTYIDCVRIDTPIFDHETYPQALDVNTGILERLESGSEFIRYLKDVFKEHIAGLAQLDFYKICSQLEDEIQLIRNRALYAQSTSKWPNSRETDS